MDKIYTRKRIKLPKIRYVGFNLGKNRAKKRLVFNMAVILGIAIVTLFLIINSISPIIDKVCADAAKAKATIVTNNMTTEVMKNYTYDDIVNIYKDSQGNISMIQSNIITINEITSDIALKVQEELKANDENTINVKFRKLYRNKDLIRNWTRHSY